MAENLQPRRLPSLEAIPLPWRKKNPSAWSQRVPVALLAVVALVISVYLGLYQWELIDDAWDPVFGDQTRQVLDSEVSHTLSDWLRMPDAILGAAAYLGDAVFALAGSQRRWQYRPWIVIIFGIDVIPLGIVSATLVFMQGFVVDAWCFLCLVTAVISLTLIVFAYDEVWSSLVYLHRVWKRADDRRIFWDTLWGRPSPLAHEIGETMIADRSS